MVKAFRGTTSRLTHIQYSYYRVHPRREEKTGAKVLNNKGAKNPITAAGSSTSKSRAFLLHSILLLPPPESPPRWLKLVTGPFAITTCEGSLVP